MDLGLQGRTAAVAAASTGLGFAAAGALAAEGVTVVICGRDQGRVADAAARIGPRCIPLVRDVSTQEGGTRFVQMAQEALGVVDILVANAGGPPAGTFATTDPALYEPALRLNLLSTVGMRTAAVPPMRERGWGRVIGITSVAVRQPIANLILSNTARAGVTGYLKTLAREVAGDGVTVNTAQPGLHRTERVTQLYGEAPDAAALGIPAGTIGDPADFGAVVTFLSSEQARFVTGVQLHVDGGAYGGLL